MWARFFRKLLRGWEGELRLGESDLRRHLPSVVEGALRALAPELGPTAPYTAAAVARHMLGFFTPAYSAYALPQV